MPQGQDIANLILFVQSEIYLYRNTGDGKHLDNCLAELRRAIEYLEVEPWYTELLESVRDQLGRLDEWG
ncbi:hypothetical protein [Gloeobacter kilaueensis]|uniref:Uncharacterized protein n=1 Tax=Gloeobacter kilaueensis (strain ATCC BAA-2537 / CCAP 1431/1 / ULC 316 / JS1) TaxID=1183438 RepID=U5QLB2_GLOK1|nr:hypothetical protein [Gloeobacter kilaueensis]AGY59673.1 hypothetical protein GKIL_3427 [Gloeobacter kilaueensis JS1]